MEARALRIETLKERIDRSEYRVDVEKVAEAILGRPTARLWVVPASLDGMRHENGGDLAADAPAA
jgi:hypothetical protein